MNNSRLMCRICGTVDDHQLHIGREMMFGTREEFSYFQCVSCDCLQISDIPDDLSRFYPADYYSLTTKDGDYKSPLRAFLLQQRFRNALFGRGYKLNKLLSHIISMPVLLVDSVLPVTSVLHEAKVRNFSARFLDIGCGSWSHWLASLRTMGFKYLFGADPFINSDVNHNGISIYKREIADLAGAFDLITFHHSLEHISEQQAALSAARHLLAPNGVILVRIPTVSSFAWRHYGTNWVEMDPPRHLYLHSRDSIRLLGESVGLSLYSTLGDSLDFEFYGSEQYQRDIPLTAPNSHWVCHDTQLFAQKELDNFKTKAQEVNECEDSGRACFFFRVALDK